MIVIHIFNYLVDSFMTATKAQPKQLYGNIDLVAAAQRQSNEYASSALDYYNKDENNKVKFCSPWLIWDDGSRTWMLKLNLCLIKIICLHYINTWSLDYTLMWYCNLIVILNGGVTYTDA